MTRRPSPGVPVVRSIPALLLAASAAACGPQAPEPTGSNGSSAMAEAPHVTGPSAEAIGRYLVIQGGCNDCHTEGYMEGPVPEEQWLTGSGVGFRGPWGTSYPRNLRLTAQGLTEDQWVAMLHTRKTLPPMPWVNVNQMAESDARALYRFIRSMGPMGEQPPAPIPPGQEPTTPYILFVPVMPGG